MNISINDIIDFMRCPMQYRFKHVLMLPYNVSLQYEYRKLVKKTCIFLYTAALEEKKDILKQMMRYWSSNWYDNKALAGIPVEKMDDQTTLAAKQITRFFEYAVKNQYQPVTATFPYELYINGPNGKIVTVSGEIDAIQRGKSEANALVYFLYSRDCTQFSIDGNLAMTLGSMYYRKALEFKEENIMVYDIYKGQGMSTVRDTDSYERASKIVGNIASVIESNAFYPTPSRLTCYYCPYTNICLSSKFF